LKQLLRETMLIDTSHLRLYKVNHQENMNEDRDVENMNQTLARSETRNWNSPRTIATVIQIKDVQSSIPWHPKVVFCAEQKIIELQ